jgi:hypothetical protein
MQRDVAVDSLRRIAQQPQSTALAHDASSPNGSAANPETTTEPAARHTPRALQTQQTPHHLLDTKPRQQPCVAQGYLRGTSACTGYLATGYIAHRSYRARFLASKTAGHQCVAQDTTSAAVRAQSASCGIYRQGSHRARSYRVLGNQQLLLRTGTAAGLADGDGDAASVPQIPNRTVGHRHAAASCSFSGSSWRQRYQCQLGSAPARRQLSTPPASARLSRNSALVPYRPQTGSVHCWVRKQL